MAVQICCPNPACHQAAIVPDQYVGKTVRCARCGSKFSIIPAVAASPVTARAGIPAPSLAAANSAPGDRSQDEATPSGGWLARSVRKPWALAVAILLALLTTAGAATLVVLNLPNQEPHPADVAPAVSVSPSQDDQEMRAEFRRLLLKGKMALAVRHYQEAEEDLAQALVLLPEDTEATDLLHQARTALRDQAAREQEQKQRAEAEQKAKLLGRYQAALTAGQEALTEKRYDDAIDQFAKALDLVPGDAKAAARLKAARQAKANAQEKIETAERERRDEFQHLLQRGQDHLKKKRFDNAIDDFQAALQLKPDDPNIPELLQEAHQGARRAADLQQRQSDFKEAMEAGRLAMKHKRYDDAVAAYTAATRIMPADKTAAGKLKIALRVRKRLDDDVNQKVDTLKNQAKAALARNWFGDAIDAYQQVLKLRPGDVDTKAALDDARRSLNIARPPYVEKIRDAQTAVLGNSLPLALRLADDAVRMAPSQQEAAAALLLYNNIRQMLPPR